MFKKKKPKPIKTWRTIPQPAFTRSATVLGWLKQVKKGLKWILYAMLGALLVLGCIVGVRHQSSSQATLCHGSLGKGQPPKLYIKTDGALTEDHILAALALPASLGLLELDLNALKRKITALPEVKAVTLEKDLPDKLYLYITEHRPMARIACRVREGKTTVLFVSEEGWVFQPSVLSQKVKDLPWLEGITLRPKGNAGFESLPQLVSVAPLLQQAKLAKPKLYTQFKSIQCKEIDFYSTAPWSVVHIRTESWGEWVFATKDYLSQLEKLEAILAELSTRRSKRVKVIDLSLEGQAVVSFF